MGSEPRSTRGSREISRSRGGARAKPLRLLFVEDDDDFLAVLRVLIRRVDASWPVEATFLSTVADAQRIVEGQRVDAIVSDYHLPDGTGIEVLEHARSKSPRSRRVILTGHPEAARRTKSFAGSVHRLWDKGLNPRELQRRIERLVYEMTGPAN